MGALEAILAKVVASDPEDRQTPPTCLLVIMSTQDATLAAPPKPGQSSFYWNKIMFHSLLSPDQPTHCLELTLS